MKKGLTPAKTTRRRGRRTAIDWGKFPGQSIAVGPCGPGEHSSKLIRSRQQRQAQYSTCLARDGRPLPERFTLGAKKNACSPLRRLVPGHSHRSLNVANEV